MTVSMNKTSMKETFPGTNVEPKWSLSDAINLGPLFGMYLLLGARVVDAPNAHRQHTTLLIDDSEMVLATDDYIFSRQLAENYITSYLDRKGYITCQTAIEVIKLFRSCPSMIVDAIRWMQDDAFAAYDVGEVRTKMFWLHPDNGACGYYRSEKPQQYLDANYKDNFFTQIASFINYKAVTYFDAFAFSRVPVPTMVAMLQNLKLENKVLLFETDDDLLNIPDWSISRVLVDQLHKDMFETCRDLADIIFVTNETLRHRVGKPEITYVAPNLIDMDRFTNLIGKQRSLVKEYLGFVPRRVKGLTGNNIKYVNKKGEYLTEEQESRLETDYKPVRILWYGSNTHDADIDQILPAVRAIGEEYGIGIKFFWFGYCPTTFAEVGMLAGNVAPQIGIKAEYAHYMEYIQPVELNKFPEMLRRISPDFALCPLLPHPFNECKSNLKPLEMGAMGVPSVVSDYGEYKFIKNRYDGIKVEHSDNPSILTARWVAAMSQMIDQRHLRVELATNIHKRVWDEYSWQIDSENRQKWDKLFVKIKELVDERKAAKLIRMGPMFPARQLNSM